MIEGRNIINNVSNIIADDSAAISQAVRNKFPTLKKNQLLGPYLKINVITNWTFEGIWQRAGRGYSFYTDITYRRILSKRFHTFEKKGIEFEAVK